MECLVNNASEENEDSRNYSYCRNGDIIYLKFKSNTLYAFPSKKFLNYPDITYLSLPNNYLKNLEEDVFLNFPNLTWLDIRDNRIQTFPKVTNHKCLEQILLGGNKIEKLPIELGSFVKLFGLQVTGNPLVFPDMKVLEAGNLNLVEFLKLCWKHQTKNPLAKLKEDKVPDKKKHIAVKKEEVMAPVQQYKNVANVVAEKIKSNNPIDQLMANNVLKKLRAIEIDLKRTNDRNALKEWRDKYISANVAETRDAKLPPYGIDPEFMSMMSRRDLNNEDLTSQKKKYPVQTKKVLNVNEELKKVDMELDSLKFRKPSLDPLAEKTQRMMDIQKMSNIQKKIKELQLVNLKNA